MPSGDFLYVIWLKRYGEKTRKKIDFLAKVTPFDGIVMDASVIKGETLYKCSSIYLYFCLIATLICTYKIQVFAICVSL